MSVNGRTVNLGVIGCPVEHSISPQLHNAMARILGLDYIYSAYPVEKGEVKGAIEGMRALGIRGLNVTIPHKIDACNLADELDPFAEKMGAVNTLVNENGVIKGYNTDGPGFIRSLARGGVTVKGKKCVIIGAGGAAMGVAMALAAEGAFVFVMNRTPEKADALCERINRFYPDTAQRCESVEEADILINATSVGMNTNKSPIGDSEFDKLKKTCVAADIVYCPRRTRFLREAEKRGLKTVGGIGMLINQAVIAFELFTGEAVPKKVTDCLYAMTEMKKSIVLTGFMGTGKSAVGRELKSRTGMNLFDTDDMIEEKHGKITDIFSSKGEEYFRLLESETIKEAALPGRIISLGGGAVLKRENIDIFKKSGFVVRLKADIERVFKNIGSNTGSRPLLSGKTMEEAKELLLSREEYYKNCDFEIDVTSLEKEETADRIINAYYEFCLKEALENER